MAMRVTWFVVVAALAVGCEQRSSQPAEAGKEASALAGESAQPRGSSGPPPERDRSAPSTLDKVVAAVTPKAEFKEVTIPSGTAVNLTLETAVGSDTSRIEDTVRAKVSQPIMIAGLTAVPAGSQAVGAVTGAEQSGKVKGLASISLRFNRLTAWDETQEISTARLSRQAAATKKKDATKIGIGAGAGAVIGAIAGEKGRRSVPQWAPVVGRALSLRHAAKKCGSAPARRFGPRFRSRSRSAFRSNRLARFQAYLSGIPPPA
jgi:hypothetical protein